MTIVSVVENSRVVEATSTGDPGYLSWTLSLDAPAAQGVTVDLAYLSGTASVGSSSSGSDAYDFNSPDGVTFLPGETSKTVYYRINADSTDETDESVILEVRNPENAALAGNAPVLRSTAWILDDDGAGTDLAVHVSRPVLIEGDAGQSQASFEVSLSRPAPEAFSVAYQTVDGSAVAGQDYEARSGTLSFVAGQTSASVTVPVFGDTDVEPTELFTLDIDRPAAVAAISLGAAEIRDDDAGAGSVPTVSVAAASNFEATSTGDPGYLSWTLSLDAPAAQGVTVDLAYLSGTASVGSSSSGSDAYDFNSPDGVTFLPGETSKTVYYRINADSTDETDESVILEVRNPENAALAGNAPVLRSTAWILDDDGAGTDLAVHVSRPVLIEGDAGQSQASFEVSLSRPAPEAFSVAYQTVDGSAVAGQDYEARSGTLSFVAGQTSASVTVPVFGDTDVEPTELFTLDIDRPAAAAAISLGAAEIRDDDAGAGSVPTVSVAAASNFEATSTGDPGYLSWTLSLDAPAAQGVTVDLAYLSGTASVGSSSSGSDAYDFNSPDGVTFLPGETSKTVYYRINADSTDETDESVILEVRNPENAALAGNAPVLRSTAWILDDDGAGTDLAVHVSRPVLIEGDAGQSQASFEVSLSRPAPEAFSVAYQTVDGSAVAGQDYEARSGTLSFVAGQTSASVTVPVFGDTDVEPTELFTLDIDRPAAAAAISLGAAEIRDDDAGAGSVPTVSVAAASNFEATSTGDPGYLSWTLSLDAPAAQGVTVDLAYLSGTASVGSSSSGSDAYDFNSPDGVTFLPGETSKTVYYRINADSTDETDESVILEVRNPENAALAGNAPVLRSTAWILDDDGAGTDLAVHVSRPVLIEGDAGQSQASFEVSLSRPAPEAFSVAYQTVDGSAVAGQDYEARSGTLSFVAGQTSASVTVPVFGDTDVEPTELFTLDIDRPAAAAAISLGAAEIRDDDAGAGSVPTVSVAAASNFEATSTGDPGYLSWTLSLDAPAAQGVTVDLAYLSGTASVGSSSSGSDAYDFNSPDGVTFLPGETSKTVYYRINADSTDETDESVILEVRNPENAALAGNAPVLRSTAWILDDDGAGTDLAVHVSRPVLIEGDAGQSQASFEVSLSRPAPEAFSVAYQTVDGSAVAGQDYEARSGTLSFVAGQTSASVTVPVFGDTDVEPTELFTLDIDRPAAVAAISLGAAEIRDDDAGAGSVPTVSVAAASNFEATSTGDPGYLSWTLSLDAPAAQGVTVDLAYLSGTASVGSSSSGSDAYDFNSPDSVTFLPGETSKTVYYRINADSTDETDESVILEVRNPENAALAGNAPVLRSTAWILDDDGAGTDLAVHVSRPVLIEGDAGQSQASFEVSLSRPAPEAFSVAYQTVDGSAVAGQDYEARSGTLSFVAGQTSASVTVPVFGDTDVEPTELFTLDIDRPAAVAAISLGAAEIRDDDAGAGSVPTVSVAAASNFEATSTGDPGYLSWTLSLDAPATQGVTVDLAYLSGTASVGSSSSGSDAYDFNSPDSVTFLPGETSKTVYYRINADSTDETDESVILEVRNPENAALAGNAPVLRSTAWILDDDGAGTDLAVHVSDVDVPENVIGGAQAVFEITLSRPAATDLSFGYATAGDTATSGADFVATDGSVTVSAGQTTAAVIVPIVGDALEEPTERFGLTITPPAGVAGDSVTATGWIVDNAFIPPTSLDPLPGTGAGNDDVRGSDGVDVGTAGAGDDTVRAGGGNDTIDGGTGNDRINGQDGADDLRGGPDNDRIFGNGDGDLIDGEGGNDVIFGNLGDDTLHGGAGNDQVSGNEGDDSISGDDGRDSLFGGDGADTISGGDDRDLLQGDDGADSLCGDGGNDDLFGGRGEDTLKGGAGDDLAIGQAGDDLVEGDGGNDRLFGIGGSDTLEGGSGIDNVFGGTGNDSLSGGSENDQLFGEQGADTLDGGSGNDKLFGGSEEDRLDGGTGDDFLFGDGGNDSMLGGEGTDQLFAGAGDDRLDGGRGIGVDRATGGGGADTFVYAAGDDRLVITDFDFAAGDRVELTGIAPSEFAAWTLTSVAGGSAALVAFDGLGEVRFDGTDVTDLDQGWFV